MNPRVGWVAVVLAAMVMGAAGAYAQDTALGTSSWSLEFGTSLGASGDEFSEIALRRHLSERSALRIGLGGNVNGSEGDGTETQTPNPTIDVMRINTFYNYQVSLQWVHYAAVMDRVAAQFGIGPVLEVFRNHNRNTEQFGLPGFNESEFRSDEMLYGLDLSLGVDWFFTRRLSLGGRASLQAMMGTRHEVNMFRTSSSRNTNQVEQDRLDVRTGGGNIYLTGYF